MRGVGGRGALVMSRAGGGSGGEMVVVGDFEGGEVVVGCLVAMWRGEGVAEDFSGGGESMVGKAGEAKREEDLVSGLWEVDLMSALWMEDLASGL